MTDSQDDALLDSLGEDSSEDEASISQAECHSSDEQAESGKYIQRVFPSVTISCFVGS